MKQLVITGTNQQIEELNWIAEASDAHVTSIESPVCEMTIDVKNVVSLSRSPERILTVEGTADGLSSLRRILDKLSATAAQGAGVTVKMEAGDGIEDIGYIDGDGNEHFKCVKETQLSSESKKKSARSMMLKMIMPMLSGGDGEALQTAIQNEDGKAAHKAMQNIAKKLKNKLDSK